MDTSRQHKRVHVDNDLAVIILFILHIGWQVEDLQVCVLTDVI